MKLVNSYSPFTNTLLEFRVFRIPKLKVIVKFPHGNLLVALFRIIFLCFLTVGTYGQTPKLSLKITIGENILVASKPSTAQLIELHLTSHPSDPGHLLAVGWVINTSNNRGGDPSIDHCATFVSKDGGLKWERNDLTVQKCADPWVTLTDEGAVLTTLANFQGAPDYNPSQYQLLSYFSSDGGLNWSKTPQSFGNGHDGPRSIADSEGTIYLVSHRAKLMKKGVLRVSIFVGKKLSTPLIEKTALIYPSNLNLAMDGITTFSDGSIGVIYQDFQRPVTGPRRDENGNWRGVLKTRREWLITSSDKGKTFSEPKLVTELCYDRANDLVSDKSNGVYKDRLYTSCSDTDYKSILFTYSMDQGETWADAKPIELSEAIEGIRIEPMMAVNKDGILAIAWFDSRDKPESGRCYSPYIAFSTDGGESFGKPVKVASEESCVNPALSGYVASRWPEGGDYFGLTAAADGRFHILWPDARSGKFELMTASISVQLSN